MMTVQGVLPLIVLALLCKLGGLDCFADVAENISMPLQFAAEGKIVVTESKLGKIRKEQYAFNEIVNSNLKSSVVTMERVGSDPVAYYMVPESQGCLIKRDKFNFCRPGDQSNLIPELWFIVGLLEEFLEERTEKDYLIGPIGLISALIDINNDQNKFKTLTGRHRGINCIFKTIEKKKISDAVFVEIELVIPKLREQFSNRLEEYLTARVKLLDEGDSTPSLKKTHLEFIVDFYSFETKGKSINEEMQLVDTWGCSRILENLYPKVEYPSFKMVYKSQLKPYDMIFYDHDSNYMRTDHVIWDLNEGFAYVTARGLACSALNVTSEKLAPAYKPFLKPGSSLSVNEFFGLQNLAYLGMKDRQLVFETELFLAPYFFRLTSGEMRQNETNPHKYLLKLKLEDDPNGNWRSKETAKPLKLRGLTLNKYFTTGEQPLVLVRDIDVESFLWTHVDESFSAPECADDETDMQRLELMIKLDGVHPRPVDDDHKKAIESNFLGLKHYLIETILNKIQVSRLHLIEQQVFFAQNHIGVDLLLADRSNSLELNYIGKVAQPDESVKNQLSWEMIDERKCLEEASLIPEILFVYHCPAGQSREKSLCIAIHGQQSSSFSNSTDPEACTMHEFKLQAGPRKSNLDFSHDELAQIKFSYEAKIINGATESSLILSGSIINYEVFHQTKPLTVNDFKYVYNTNDPANVRQYESMNYRSEEDCERMCNLDVSCKSYSYCDKPDLDERCLISSLDIRASDVNGQLEKDHPSNYIEVHDENNTIYKIEEVDSCNLFERDYLGSFSLTKKLFKLPKILVPQIPKEPSAGRCAYRSIELERKHSGSNHQVASFAYCPTHQSCILEESMISFDSNSSTDSMKIEGPLCRVYRKKYQTYFDVSKQVLKVDDSTKDFQKTILLENVEDCAWTCWHEKRDSCVSFDFCSPGSCLINQIGRESSSFKGEERSNCLHYEKNSALLSESRGSSSGSKKLFFWLLMVAVSLASMAIGLSSGRRLKAKPKAVRGDATEINTQYAKFEEDDNATNDTDNIRMRVIS